MKTLAFPRLHAGLLILALAAVAAAAPPANEYKVTKKVVLGGDGGWDYVTVDSKARRVYVARATRVMVLDADSGTLISEIPNTPGVHGVALVPDLGRGVASNGRENTALVFDLKTLAEIKRVPTGTNPDAITYDPASHRVFTFNGRSGDATAIDPAEGTAMGTVALGGKPEAAVFDGEGHIWVNIEDKSEVVLFDSKSLTVKSRWPLAPCEEPTGLAFDKRHHRLFAGCGNKMMAVMDSETGKVVATVPTGPGVDGTAFDPETQLAFSTNGGDGTLTVVHEDSPDKYTVVQTVETGRGARTIALDPTTHTIYTVTAQFGPPPEATPQQPRPRPPQVPGTFQLLVIARQ